MNDHLHKWWHYAIISAGEASVLFLCAVILLAVTGKTMPEGIPWLVADAGHYFKIAEEGYSSSSLLSAFFPLFPKTWSIIGFTPKWMAILNGAVAVTSSALIGYHFRLSLKYYLLWTVFPLVVFFFFPYYESFFALGVTAMLIGCFKRAFPWLLAGVLVCSFSRPTASILIPCFILLLAFGKGFKKELALSSLFSLVGFIAALSWQSFETGNILGFFEAQKEWGNEFGIHSMPMTTWGGGFNTFLDGLALYFALICGGLFLYQVRKKQKDLVNLLVLAFLGGTGLLVVLTMGGELFSLSRFIFGVPFFAIAMILVLETPSHWKKTIALGLIVFPLLFGIHVHIQTFIMAMAVPVLLIMWGWLWGKNKRWATIICLTGVFALQVYTLSLLLQNIWVA